MCLSCQGLSDSDNPKLNGAKFGLKPKFDQANYHSTIQHNANTYKNQPTKSLNSFVLIAGNLMRCKVLPNFERMFFPSLGSSPDFSHADFAQPTT